MRKTTSKTQKSLRVQVVYEMLSRMIATGTIIDYGMKEWNVKRATVRSYLNIAQEQMRENLSTKKKNLLYQAIAQREFLLEKLVQAGQFAMAAQLLGDQAKLLGLYEPEQIEVTTQVPVIHLHKVATQEEFEAIDVRSEPNIITPSI